MEGASEISAPVIPGVDDDAKIFPEMRFVKTDEPESYYACSTRSDRTYDEYTAALGFDPADVFPGGRILDIGSGVKATFAAEARERGLQVFPLNPLWSKDHLGEDYATGTDNRWVRAVSQRLPYIDDSFDFVVSLLGVPLYLPGTPRAYYDTFSEAQRVLRPNGVGLFMPLMKRVVNLSPHLKPVLGAATGNAYEILGNGNPPKLMIAKHAGALASENAAAVRKAADRNTANYATF